MSELQELYQEVILDHNKRPRNFGAVEEPDCEARGHNPLCGDQLEVTIRLDDDSIGEVRFCGSGCAISKASASLMTEIVAGHSVEETETIFSRFHDLVTGEAEVEPEELGKLEVLSGVREFPARVKCATLAWHALRAAIAGGAEEVSTE